MSIYPFLDNKYKRWHDAIVERARERETPECYVERHHVVPRCLDGSDDSENIVALTAREHFVIHLLLTKMTTNDAKQKMNFALAMMSAQKKRRRLTSWEYERSRKAAKEGAQGQKHSNETKKKLRRSMTAERRSKISKFWKGRTFTQETRLKLSVAAKKRTHTKESKRKMSEAIKTRPRVSCILCRKEISVQIFFRDHNRNCRFSN